MVQMTTASSHRPAAPRPLREIVDQCGPMPSVNREEYQKSAPNGQWKKLLGRIALGVGCASLMVATRYTEDVMAVREELRDARPVIELITSAENPADSHRLIVGIGGLATTNADNMMHALPFETLGTEVSLNDDKRGIDTTKDKQVIIDFAKRHHIEEIIIVGTSMGGVRGMEVASLIQDDPDAPMVTDIILDCTPPNLAAVQEDKRRAGDRMLALSSQIPGHRDSRYLRGIGEMMSRYRQYTNASDTQTPVPFIDVKQFMHEANDVYSQKMSPEAGTIGLLEDQYRQIALDGVGKSFQRMEHARKPSPRIHYIRPLKAESDTTVNIEKAVEIMTEQSKTYHLSFEVHTLEDGTWHASPGQTPRQYGKLVLNHIIPTIRKKQSMVTAGTQLEATAVEPAPTRPRVTDTN